MELTKSFHLFSFIQAAEALGSIAEDECSEILHEFQKDDDLIVKQSCDVALDILDYWTEDSGKMLENQE